MSFNHQNKISRRRFLQSTAVGAAGLSIAPYLNCGKTGVTAPMKRPFGKLDFEVTTLGLGGQASIQWTPEDVDPVKIILKAFEMGVNYFDTSNLYGPSQANFGKAFQQLNLIPGQAGYDEKRRRSIFLTSKTHLRWAKGEPDIEGVGNWTHGPRGSKTIDDVKRTLSQIFGDGQGNYPEGAYLNLVLIHSLRTLAEVDALYAGVENTDPSAENIGALAALRDYRDGTNLTGLNPREEKLIRHIGFSGHFSPPVMMEMIQRDQYKILDGLLVAINPNDRLNFNMQYNVIPVAAAKNIGIIAMKVFADGALYSKAAEWSREPAHVVRTVGSPELPSRPLVEYALTTPGIGTAIIGIGEISENPEACQLTQNFSAAQILPAGLSETDRRAIEKTANQVKDGQTNYFQSGAEPLSAPQAVACTQQKRDDQRLVELTWHTAYAGDEPIKQYQIWRDDQKIATVEHRPQIDKTPFKYEDPVADEAAHTYKVVTVDAVDRTASSEALIVEPMV